MIGEKSTDCCLCNEAKFTMKNGYKKVQHYNLSLSLAISRVPPICVQRGYLYMLLLGFGM